MLRFNIKYEYTIEPLQPPRLIWAIPDQSFPLGGGWESIDGSACFAGTGLDYALVTGNQIARIDATTGEILLDTANLLDSREITVRARNAAGTAEARFRLSVYPVGVGYWKIADNFIVS